MPSNSFIANWNYNCIPEDFSESIKKFFYAKLKKQFHEKSLLKYIRHFELNLNIHLDQYHREHNPENSRLILYTHLNV